MDLERIFCEMKTNIVTDMCLHNRVCVMYTYVQCHECVSDIIQGCILTKHDKMSMARTIKALV